MVKAILVMDMPSKCKDCPLHEMASNFDKYLCSLTQNLSDKFANIKPNWCPLRELPQKKTLLGSKTTTELYKIGYNNCIDDILGKEDK